MEVFVARQPIFDQNRLVHAYELLYRTGEQNFFDGSISSNMATSILLMNSYYSFGIDNLIGSHKAFINFSKALIENDIPHLLNEQNVVIELLEDIKPDPFFIQKVKNLKEKGYTIALDDFVESYPYVELIELSDIIKVDFLLNTREQIKSICSTWKKKGKLLLAEKVETNEEFLWAKGLGFDYFQGYFFSKPSVMKSKTLTDSAYQYIRLMEKLNKPEPDYKEIASIIEVDVSLTYKLLKLVNSRFALVSNISSIQHALAILGITAFRKWVSLAMIQSKATSSASELAKISLIRSHFMEGIAKASDLKKYASEISLIGILSVVDVLLESPMEEIVKNLPLSETIKDTLLGKDSQYSCVYGIVKQYEMGNFTDILGCCTLIKFDSNKLPQIYLESVKWSEELFEYMC